VDKIKRLIVAHIPVTTCNLRCKYCYIYQQNQFDAKLPDFKYDAEHIGKALSIERLGGICLINLTAGGETLLPNQITGIIKELLKQGHYLEVVTNGLISKRFDAIAAFPKELLSRLQFKFSFHYLELLRLNKIDQFFKNINQMNNAGCSFTVEMTPSDELIPHKSDILKLCEEKLKVPCHLTVARNDNDKNKGIFSRLSYNDYQNTWSDFNSKMFNFKMDILGIKRKEYCYAGDWSFYLNVGNGDIKPCYGKLVTQNIFKNISKPIKFRAIGKRCVQPYCYNGHAFLTVGIIPELKTPTYSDIRNRISSTGEEWHKNRLKAFFSSKLIESNKEYNINRKRISSIYNTANTIPNLFRSYPQISEKLRNKLKNT